ncbi:MAG: ParB N-terminal domain-containing protein [Planctomycetes bacterium]|nr:ParB N-terminal domain-containing protein [Planctomycetota bacterium]
MSDVAATEKIRETWEPKERVDLGENLELWKVPLPMMREQNLNARSMTSDTFLQLVDNIKRTNRLESLPLLAVQMQGEKLTLEIVSGHHRTRAARKAGLDEVWALVDTSNLSRDRVRAKQLAHNSISGTDNPDLLAQIFGQITDVDARIEAFIEPDLSKYAKSAKLITSQFNVEMQARVVSILFLPVQEATFKEAMERLAGTETSDVYLAARDEYDTLTATMGKLSEAYDIRSTPTLFARMAQIVNEHLAAQEKTDGEGTDETA